MPFNTLLFKGLIHGTSYTQSGVCVSVTPQSGEMILFFVLDNSDVCKQLNIEKQPKCDLLVFYRKGHNTVLCLTEMKGGNVSHASHQIEQTRHYLSDALTSSTIKGNIPDITWKACICNNTKSHLVKTKDSRLKDQFSKNVRITRNGNIGEYLRE